MDKCLEICMVKAGVSVVPTYTKIPFKPSTITTTSSPSFKGRANLIACCNYSVNEVEVVTACSWTELVVAADMPVLVEFWASRCGPSAIVDQVAKEYDGKALCYKLNIDDYPNVPLQYGITSIPSVLFYVNGETKENYVIDDHVSKSTLCAILDKYLLI